MVFTNNIKSVNTDVFSKFNIKQEKQMLNNKESVSVSSKKNKHHGF